MSATLDWDDLRLVLAVARHGSLRAAAAILSVNQSTLSRRIRRLEDGLGVRLFDRLPSGLTLTPAGERMLEAGERIEEEVSAASRLVVGQDAALRGTLRLTTTDPLATRLLIPHVAAFAAAHPEVELEIASTFEFLSLARREADIALRVSRSSPAGLVGQRVATVAVAVYASAALVEREGGTVDLDRLPWIAWKSEELNSNHRLDRFPRADVRYRVDSTLTLIAAVREGMAIGSLACYHGDADPSLVRLSSPVTEDVASLWLLTHRDLRTSARVRAFMRSMSDGLAGDRDLLEGRRPARGA